MTKTNTITVARELAIAASQKEGHNICLAEYPGDRRIINEHGVPSFIDGRNGQVYFQYGIATKTKFYVCRSRKDQCDWLRDRI